MNSNLRIGLSTDLPYIVGLANRHAREVGFLPREAMATYLARGQVTVATGDEWEAGYLLHGRVDRGQVRIFQACVQTDARRRMHGERLVCSLIVRLQLAGCQHLTLHCRDGLESNSFWEACGFSLSRIQPGGHARRKVINVWSLFVPTALAIPHLPYGRAYFDHWVNGGTASYTPASTSLTLPGEETRSVFTAATAACDASHPSPAASAASNALAAYASAITQADACHSQAATYAADYTANANRRLPATRSSRSSTATTPQPSPHDVRFHLS